MSSKALNENTQGEPAVTNGKFIENIGNKAIF